MREYTPLPLQENTFRIFPLQPAPEHYRQFLERCQIGFSDFLLSFQNNLTIISIAPFEPLRCLAMKTSATFALQ